MPIETTWSRTPAASQGQSADAHDQPEVLAQGPEALDPAHADQRARGSPRSGRTAPTARSSAVGVEARSPRPRIAVAIEPAIAPATRPDEPDPDDVAEPPAQRPAGRARRERGHAGTLREIRADRTRESRASPWSLSTRDRHGG